MGALVVFGFVLTVVFTVGLVAVLRHDDAAKVRELRRDGRTAVGTVTGLGIDHGDGMVSGTYWAEVDCLDTGERFTTRVTLSREQYEGLYTGYRLVVTYLLGNPRSARVLP